MSVNLPPAALTDIAFPDEVIARLRGTGLRPQQLHFEITETSIAREPLAALDILTRLRLKGFALAIDDFGTGYSSLEKLRQLPFSALKIDKTFVRRMDRDPPSRAIVENCIDLGHDLGLTVVAEGAETASVWDALSETACDLVQGFFVREPAEPEVVAQVSERAFDRLAASAHETAATAAANPAPVAVHRRLRVRRLRPVPAAAVRLRNVGPDLDGVQVDHRLIAVIPLVSHDLFQRLRLLDVRLRVFDLLGGRRGRLDDRRGVALVGALQRHRDDRAGLHVDRMLRFVGQMRPAISSS